MNGIMEVLVGHSFASKDVVIVKEAKRIGVHKDPEGNVLGPEYDSDTESWLNRNDMDCSILCIKKNQFSNLEKRYQAFIQAANDQTVSDETVKELKKAVFTLLAV